MLLVLAAAFLHALANALVKISEDPLLTRGFMSAVSALVMLPALAFVAPPAGAWHILLASAAVHACYPFLVAAAYRRADLSIAFPVARGIAPVGLLVLVATFDASGVTAVQTVGVCVVALGILVLTVHRSAFASAAHGAGLAYAVATGAVVSLYTYLDAHGIRAAPSSMSYIAWLVVVDGAATCASIAAVRGARIAPFVAAHWRPATVAAVLGLLNFGMALYALGMGNIVEIGALRETSVVFAAFMGARFLGEAHAARRVTAAGIVALGVAVMQLFR